MGEYIKRNLAKAEFTGDFRDEYPTALIHALIDSVPAADVVERKRGKWIAEVPSSPSAGYLKLRCGECNAEYTFISGTGFSFCPNCGADMREES